MQREESFLRRIAMQGMIAHLDRFAGGRKRDGRLEARLGWPIATRDMCFGSARANAEAAFSKTSGELSLPMRSMPMRISALRGIDRPVSVVSAFWAHAVRQAGFSAIRASGEVLRFFRMVRTPRILFCVRCAIAWDCHGKNSFMMVVSDWQKENERLSRLLRFLFSKILQARLFPGTSLCTPRFAADRRAKRRVPPGGNQR